MFYGDLLFTMSLMLASIALVSLSSSYSEYDTNVSNCRLDICLDFGGDSSDIDFTSALDTCKTTQSFGKLQNTRHSADSTEKIGAISNYSHSRTYEILCVYRSVYVRSRMSSDSAAGLFLNTDDWKSNWTDFHCFAFVYAMKDPDNLEDSTDEVDFPCRVETYKRLSAYTWLHIETATVRSYSELSELQFKTIYADDGR